MLPKLFKVLVISLAIQIVCGTLSHHGNPQKVNSSDPLITYYDPSTGVVLEGGKNDSTAAMIYRHSLCDYKTDSVSCCVGVHFFGFKGSVCLNTVFNGLNEIRIELTANQRSLFSHLISASKRQCVSLPHFSYLRVCDQIDIEYQDQHVKVCGSIAFKFRLFSFERRKSPSFHFSCISFGVDGVHLGNSEIEQAQHQITSQSEQQIAEPEIYDEVNFEQQDLDVHDMPLSPAEEALIGQLKL